MRLTNIRSGAYLLALFFVLSVAAVRGQSHSENTNPTIEVTMGLQVDGTITDDWYKAIKDRLPIDEARRIRTTRRPLTEGEGEWLHLIRVSAVGWGERRIILQKPFTGISLPKKTYILVGNQIGDDGFTYRDDTICVDVAAMEKNYGDASTDENQQRLVRLLDHEYTHLVHHEWIRRNPISMKTPFDRALRDLWVEGFGNYRSLSQKWVDDKGRLTDSANRTLNVLEPIFVERVVNLSVADETAEAELIKGLSRGPFNKKWGALPVALWLARESKGEDENLRKWVEAGPGGVIELAKLHLSAELRSKLLIGFPKRR